MTQHPYDQLSKQLLEELLTPLGTVQRSLEIPGEAKWVDLWFVPDSATLTTQPNSDLLARIAQKSCLLEPYRNPPSRVEVRSCLQKLLWAQEDLRRKAEQQAQTLTEQDLPQLWIVATSISKPVLQDFGATSRDDWDAGIYFSPPGYGMALVSINQLPVTSHTLILRVLGRGSTQKEAIEEILALPTDDAQRSQLIRILGNWKVAIELNQLEVEEQESIMAFSQAFLEWEKATEQKGIEQGIEQGERSLILRQLVHKIGAIAPENRQCIQSLSLEKVETLGEALLDFNHPRDLQIWLDQNL